MLVPAPCMLRCLAACCPLQSCSVMAAASCIALCMQMRTASDRGGELLGAHQISPFRLCLQC